MIQRKVIYFGFYAYKTFYGEPCVRKLIRLAFSFYKEGEKIYINVSITKTKIFTLKWTEIVKYKAFLDNVTRGSENEKNEFMRGLVK
jgi:hypothetical protein